MIRIIKSMQKTFECCSWVFGKWKIKTLFEQGLGINVIMSTMYLLTLFLESYFIFLRMIQVEN